MRPATLGLPLLLGYVGLLLAAQGERVDDPVWTNKFDTHFHKYTKHYFGAGFDWRWFKSQGIAESGLQASAKSSSGAIGLMQILPSTFAEIKKQKPDYASIKTPRWNIAAAIYYDRYLYKRWQKQGVASRDDGLALMFASYNAGFARINGIAAKTDQQDDLQWDQVRPNAPPQTRHYVQRIGGLMGRAL
jgi:soluble lytic murein transglycosylase-like protein